MDTAPPAPAVAPAGAEATQPGPHGPAEPDRAEDPGRSSARSPLTAAVLAVVGPVRAWASAHSRLVTAAGTLVTVIVLAVVLAGRWSAFADAAVGASGWLLGAAVVLHVGSLAARSEAWFLSVRAAGGTVGRRPLYRAASIGFVGNIVNGELGFALRIASLRRSSRTEVPKVTTLVATEVPLVVVEVTVATLTSFTLVGPLGLPWWAPLAGFVVMLAVAYGLRRAGGRRAAGGGGGAGGVGGGRTWGRRA